VTSLWLVPLGLICSINPEGDLGALVKTVDSVDAERWGAAARITGRKQPSDDDDAPLYLALTFDDGPSARVTPQIVATLEEYEVTATFFAVGWRFEGRGKRARAQAAVLREVVRRGYAVGNHTVNHDDLRHMTTAEARHQIDYNERMMVRETGRRPYLFRAPYGALNPKLRAYLQRRGYTEVGWNIDAHDYRPKIADTMPERMLAAMIEKGGGVVLLHDTKPWTARGLPDLLKALQSENCRRRDAGERLLVPVTLDFFVREADGSQRAIPAEARVTETRYLDRLDRVCPTN